MNYKLINKKAFDVPNFRLSLSLPIIFSAFLIFGIIFGLISENRIIWWLVITVISIIVLLILLSFMIYIFTLKKLTFQKDKIVIDGIDYQWNKIEIIYYDQSEIITLKWNTVCIKYYNPNRNLFVETYIRCKVDDYNDIMAVRN